MNSFEKALQAVAGLDIPESAHMGQRVSEEVRDWLAINLKAKKEFVSSLLATLRRNDRLYSFLAAAFAALLIVGLWELLLGRHLRIGAVSTITSIVSGFLARTIRSRSNSIQAELNSEIDTAEGMYSLLVAIDAVERIVSDDKRDSAYSRIARVIIESSKKTR